MKVCRLARAGISGALLIVALGSLASCAVDKAALARSIDLRDADLTQVPDGVYEASYTIRPPVIAANKSVQVRVTVTAGKYEKIEVLLPGGNAKSFSDLASRIVESQHLSMDAISGATITSAAVLKAVQLAVSRQDS